MSKLPGKDIVVDDHYEKFDGVEALNAGASPALDMAASDVADAAEEHKHAEMDQSIWQAVRSCKMGLFWCFLVSMCVIMEGYDLNLLGNFMAYPEFAMRYGEFNSESNTYQLEAKWQAALNNGSGIGAFFGTLLNGILVDRFGHRRVLIGALIMLACCIFITFFAQNVVMLLIGQLLCGLPWGVSILCSTNRRIRTYIFLAQVFATTAPAYASEVLPLNLRVYMTSWTNMCFIIGQFIANGVLAGLVTNKTQWSYRIPFALQWIWPSFLVPLLFFAPDSPWHLVRHGDFQGAKRSLRRLYNQDVSDERIENIVAAITKTNALEEEMQVGTSYFDCFKGVERRRTEIACVVFAGQVLSGSSFAYGGPYFFQPFLFAFLRCLLGSYFFQQVGLSSTTTYNLNLGGTGMALFAALCCWFFIMPYVGRRRAYITGMATCMTSLLIIGILQTRAEGNRSIGLAQAVLTLVWTFVFQLSMGQFGWAIPAEVGSTRLRQKTVCIARNAYYIISVISQVVQPYFLNPTELNLKGYTGFIWAGTALITLIWAIFRLPETKGRSYEELDILFHNKGPAHKFRTTVVDTSSIGLGTKQAIAAKTEQIMVEEARF